MRVKQRPIIARGRPSKKGRPPTPLPLCMIGCFTMFFVCLYIAAFQLAAHLSREQDPGEGATSFGLDDGSTVSILDSLHGAMSCKEALDKVHRGDWVDPNNGRIYARETESSPKFRIALHDKQYDPVRWRIMEEGQYYEKEVHERFVNILSNQPRAKVLDVGANIGYYSLLSLALGHDVISFEPNPANILRLCDSLRLNDWNNAGRSYIYQNAVGDVHGEVMTLHAPRNPGQGFLKPVQPGDEQTDEHKAKTTIVSLDKFAEEQGWFSRPEKAPTICLLKVDVEGKDPHVFLGSSRLLKSGIVENILTECRRFGRPVVTDMFTVLFDAGFVPKEPNAVNFNGRFTSKEKAQAMIDWAFAKLGKGSQENVDMWWVKG